MGAPPAAHGHRQQCSASSPRSSRCWRRHPLQSEHDVWKTGAPPALARVLNPARIDALSTDHSAASVSKATTIAAAPGCLFQQRSRGNEQWT